MASFFAVSLVKVEEDGFEPQYRLRIQEATTPLEFVSTLQSTLSDESGLKPVELVCIQGNILPLKSDGSKIEIAKNEYSLTNVVEAEYTNQPVYLGEQKNNGDTNE